MKQKLGCLALEDAEAGLVLHANDAGKVAACAGADGLAAGVVFAELFTAAAPVGAGVEVPGMVLRLVGRVVEWSIFGGVEVLKHQLDDFGLVFREVDITFGAFL